MGQVSFSFIFSTKFSVRFHMEVVQIMHFLT